MTSRRRSFLGSAAVVLGAVASGCLGGDGGVEYPSEDNSSAGDPTPGNETDGESDADGEPEAEDEGDEDDESDADEEAALAEATEAIVDEAAWFAAEYEDAIEAYRDAIDRAVETIVNLEASTSMTEGDVERLESVAEHLVDVAERRLEPHFDIARRIRIWNNSVIRDVRRYGERGDKPAVDERLEELRGFYETIRTQPYVDENFSRSPIRNRLVDFLSAADPPSLPLFEFEYRGEERFAARAYSEDAAESRGHPTFRNAPATEARRDALLEGYPAEAVFEGVSVADGREDELYVVVKEWEDRSESYYSTVELPSVVVYVQRFESVADAERAVDHLLSGPVFRENLVVLERGDYWWHQLYYRFEGRNVYAAVLHTGRFLLVAAPSRTGIEDRDDDWTEQLELSWLWDWEDS